MSGYSRRLWACPFYQGDERTKIHCEGGALKVYDRRALAAYADRFCGSAAHWEDCPLAAWLLRQYERSEKQHNQN